MCVCVCVCVCEILGCVLVQPSLAAVLLKHQGEAQRAEGNCQLIGRFPRTRAALRLYEDLMYVLRVIFFVFSLQQATARTQTNVYPLTHTLINIHQINISTIISQVTMLFKHTTDS